VPVIKNESFAGHKVVISSEIVLFDIEGIGTIESGELYREILKLPGFCEVKIEESEPEDSTETKVEIETIRKPIELG